MRENVNPQNHVLGWLVLGGITAVYLVSISFLLVLIWDLRRDVDLVTVELPGAVLAIERSAGSGGFIHYVSDHMQQHEDGRFAPELIENHTRAIGALDDLERIASEADLQIRTEGIRATLDRYVELILQIDEAREQGWSAAEMEAWAQINDMSAIDELQIVQEQISAALSREIASVRTKITAMTAVISILMLVLPAGALTMLWFRRRAERRYIARIEALNAGLDHRNRELATVNRGLSVTNAELSDFAHAAAHDLRTPLRGISHDAEFLVQEFGDKMDPDVTERLVHIQALCGRLDQVMTLLLRYARLSPPIQVDMVDPLSVIEEIELGIAPKLAARGGSISVETELPPIGCKRFDLGMVFQKLIENALTYNRSAEKLISIGFLREAEIGGSTVRDVLYVRDNGIGISAEYHEDVFRMFRRLHHDDVFGPGAGAGLSFVKKVLANYGGFVRLVSEPGTGTTVYFSFRRQTGEQETHTPAATPMVDDRLQAVGA